MSKQIVRIIDGEKLKHGGRLKTYLTLLMIFVAVCLFTFLTQKFKNNETAEAANFGAFDAGYIISDWQMKNYNSMSEADIQNFLTSKNPCNNRDYGLYLDQTATYPKVKWHWSDNHFVCLSEERFGDGETIGSGDTAAHIIWEAAQYYKINPQVLIVTLEKENGLVTDTLPHSGQYKTAMGFGCPDGAPCNSEYFGFKNQVYQAAALYYYITYNDWSGYRIRKSLGNNNLMWNPDHPECGTTWVNIRNYATAALYTYTPYPPNGAALNAGYGMGDTCSSYGNRNFYAYFEDWFGGIKSEVEPYEEAKTKFEQPVEDGVYRLYSKAYTDKVADIKNGLKKEGNMEVYTRNNPDSKNQMFEIKYNPEDGYYNIINPATGSALDVRSRGTNNDTPVDVYPLHSGCNQDWIIEKDKDGYYTFVSRCSGRVLDVKKADESLLIYDSHGGNNQKWKLEKVTTDDGDDKLSGTYQIYSKAFPKEVIDIKGGVKKEGELLAYEGRSTNNKNQIFEIRYDSKDGYYNIINPASGSVLDVRAKGKANDTPVDVYPLHSECNQDWKIEKDKDGYYTFVSRCSGKYLDLSRVTHGLIIYDGHGGDNQKWKLVKI